MKEQKKWIADRLKYLHEVQETAERMLKRAPEGTLRISCSEGRTQYYHRKKKTDRAGTYLHENEVDLARQLAEKDYCQRLVKAAKNEISYLEECLIRCPGNQIEEIYIGMPERRKELITPMIETDEMFLERWVSNPYKGKSFTDNVPELVTNRGERVRSKSELIIADLLDKMQIPYKYECPLVLKQIGMVYPDFTLLDLYRRKEIYWEHLGMMDDPDYAGRAIHKIRYYNINGYYQGDRLIITSETRDNPINIGQIRGLVEHILAS